MTFNVIRYSSYVFCAAIVLWATPIGAQQQAAKPTAAAQPTTGTQPSAAAAEAKAAFAQKFDEYKSAIRDIEALRIKYQTADAATREKINAELTGHVAHAQSLVNALVEAALAAYRAAPNTDPQITELLTAVARYNTIGRPDASRAGPVRRRRPIRDRPCRSSRRSSTAAAPIATCTVVGIHRRVRHRRLRLGRELSPTGPAGKTGQRTRCGQGSVATRTWSIS